MQFLRRSLAAIVVAAGVLGGGVATATIVAPAAQANPFNCGWQQSQWGNRCDNGWNGDWNNGWRQDASWRWCNDGGPQRPGERFVNTHAGPIFVRDDFPGRGLSISYLRTGIIVRWS